MRFWGWQQPFPAVGTSFCPVLTSLDDCMEKVTGELYREIKKKLYSGRKDDPATRAEVRVGKDVFDGGLALAGKSKKEREKTVYRVSSNRLNFRIPRNSFTCVGRLWRSRHNTIDAILIQWHVNELRGILKLLLSNHKLNHLLRTKWNERIFNENGDYAFVPEGTVRFWLSKTPIQEF